MPTSDTTAQNDKVELLRLRAVRREQRLHFFVVVLIGCGIAVYLSAAQPWYSIDFAGEVTTSSRVPATYVEVAETFDARDIAAIPREVGQGVANPSTSSMFGMPTFILFTIAAIALAAVGTFVASSAMIFASVIGYGYAWSSLSVMKVGFSNITSLPQWNVQEGQGMSMFAFCFTIAVVTSILAGFGAFAFQRAERAWRIADGQEVEDTMLQRLEKLIARGADRDKGTVPAAADGTAP